MSILLKRAYDAPEPSDGVRVLVDRLWPRGVTKDEAAIDIWMKDAAPSTALRKWYGHVPERFAEFSARYAAELLDDPAPLDALLDLERDRGTVTLVFAARDVPHSHPMVLARVLEERRTAAAR